MKTFSYSFLLHPVPVNIMLLLLENNECYATFMAKKIGTMYGPVARQIKRFAKLGLVQVKKDGRKKTITLTEKGKAVASHLKEIILLLAD